MKKCGKCGCQLDESASFCGECGNSVKDTSCEKQSDLASDATVAQTEAVTEVVPEKKNKSNDRKMQVEQMLGKAKEVGGGFVNDAAVKGKKTAKNVIREFKDFDYKTLKTKDGWRSFLRNKTRVISLAVAILLLVSLFSGIGGGSKKSDKELKATFIMALDEKKVMSPFSATYADLLPEVFSSYELTYEPYQSSDVAYVVRFSGEYAPNPDLDYVVQEGAISFLINIETGECSIHSIEGGSLSDTFRVYAANGY